MNTQSLQLFSTPDCHLCDVAKAIVQEVIAPMPQQYQIEAVDITQHFDLKKNYGLKIPVLRHSASGRELNWPFDHQQCWQFLLG